RLHATTRRIVVEHFAEERPALRPLPAGPYEAVLGLERRITREGMVSVGGNLYSVPDGTRRRPVEVQVTASEVRILEAGMLIAAHPILDGRGRRRIAEGHRTLPPPHNSTTPREGAAKPPPQDAAASIASRSLAIYEAIGRRLAAGEPAR
ncbi:Mu transposase domain-containing protein, partial [Roseomonas mucosa]